MGKVRITLSPLLTGISSGIVIFSYLTLKVLYFPAPSDWSTVTFGFVTVIWVSDFVTVVSDVDVKAVGCAFGSLVFVTGDSDVGLTLVVVCVDVTVAIGSLVIGFSSALIFDVARNATDNVSAVTSVTFFMNYILLIVLNF